MARVMMKNPRAILLRTDNDAAAEAVKNEGAKERVAPNEDS